MNIEEVREYALSLPGTTEDQAYGADWVLYSIDNQSDIKRPQYLRISTPFARSVNPTRFSTSYSGKELREREE
ncbi:MAG: hypothetical protein PUF37_02715 [Prevotellaceae bacterium]|nr:hypothetical protein [Prevotellaceae bacterium]